MRFDVATSNFVAYIVPTASSNSGVRRLLGTPQLFLLAVKPLWNYGEKGMRWSRTLRKMILKKATSSSSITSSFAIQKDHVGVFSKSVLNHVALTPKETWMRLEPAARGRINVNWHHMIRPKHPSSCWDTWPTFRQCLFSKGCSTETVSFRTWVPIQNIINSVSSTSPRSL